MRMSAMNIRRLLPWTVLAGLRRSPAAAFAGGGARHEPSAPIPGIPPAGRPAEPGRRRTPRPCTGSTGGAALRGRLRPFLPGGAGRRPPGAGRSHAHRHEPHQPRDRVPGRRGRGSSATSSTRRARHSARRSAASPRRSGRRPSGRRRGGRGSGSAVTTWPGADGTGPRRRADWGMVYVQRARTGDPTW